MTYGDNGTVIRAALTELLRQHRIQPRLGGAGCHTVPVSTTPEERAALSSQILRYRRSALTWCLQAATAADPHAASDPFRDTYDAGHRPVGPFEQLHHGIQRALRASTVDLPTLDELTTPQRFGLVETWRSIARAATLGEYDFDQMSHGLLTAAQALTVIKDVAAITQALVALDRRYANTPGWERLDRGGPLGWAALATALEASVEEADYTVDERGWKPPATLIREPIRPGALGALQAEHNLLIRLARGFPSPINLRLVADSQRLLSADLANRVTRRDARLHGKWQARAITYDQIHRELRNVGGRIGKGAQAAAEAANAVSRLRRLPYNAEIDPRVLAGFDKIFTHLDDRIADIIERGISENLLFLRVRVPRIVDGTGDIVQPVRERFVPITSPVQTNLPTIVRERLRPHPTPTPAPPKAAHSRRDLHNALLHQPASNDHGIAI